MSKLYVIIPLLSSLLFSHFDAFASSGDESLALTLTSLATSTPGPVGNICILAAVSLNPNDYQGCQPKHASSPEDIKKIHGFESRFKAHLKRAAVTPGHPLHDLVQKPFTVSAEMRNYLANDAIRRTLRKTLIGELKAGVLDTAELGLTEATSAEIITLGAVAPELAVPVLGMTLGNALTHMIYKSFTYINGGQQGIPYNDIRSFMESMNENNHIAISEPESRDGTSITRFNVLIPLHCKFPIVKNKLYLGNYGEAELRKVPAMKDLEMKLGSTLYRKALKNIQPIMDADQYCSYLTPTDTRKPFNPIENIEDRTREQNKLFVVIRPLIMTTYGNSETKVKFLQDKLISHGANYGPKPLTQASYLSVSLENQESFAYRGHAGQFDGVPITARYEQKSLGTFTSISFYYARNGHEFPETAIDGHDIDITMALQKENIMQHNGEQDPIQTIIGNHISVHDILDWSIQSKGTQFNNTLARVKESTAFMSIAKKNHEPDAPWLFRGKERSSEELADTCKTDTAESLARLLDFVDINTSKSGVMGQIEFMTAVAANSNDFREGALINNGLLRYGTNGYGILRFNRVFDVLLAYQRSLDKHLLQVDIKGESNGSITTKTFPNNLRLLSRSIPLEQLSGNPYILITNFSYRSDGSGENLWYKMLSEPIRDAITEVDFPLMFRDIDLKLTSSKAALQNVTLEFVIDISLQSEGKMQTLVQKKVSCNDAVQCSSKPTFSRYDNGPEAYTTRISRDNKILISITTWKNINQIRVPLKKLVTSLELKYLKPRGNVISM